MKMEIWKDIPDYEGRYQASSFGRIKSLSRKVRITNLNSSKEFMRTVPEPILKPGSYCSSGHLSVVFGHGEAGIPVHQLIMKTFVGVPPEGMEVLHINGDPMDNRTENLRYGTRTENILDVYLQGGCWRKLNIEDVVKIRFSLFCGMRGVELAREFNVSQSAISHIKLRRTFWWHK